ncbi:MAG: iron-containing alcohol dehydrogenase [Nitrososphaerota archaeon]
MPVSRIDIPNIRLGEEFSCSCGKRHRVATRQLFFGDSLETLLTSLDDITSKGGHAVIVTGPRTRLIAGETVKGYFASRGFRTLVIEVERADLATVAEVEKLASGCSLTVAVGGGNVIDSCKYAAHTLGVPFISIPTTISHDGIASPVASILLGSRRTSIMATPPVKVVIAEPLIRSSPKRLIASGCADILAKSTALRDWLLGHIIKDEYLCENTLNLTASALKDVRSFIDGGGRDFLPLASAAAKCGVAMALVGSSRPCSGAEHLFSHYLDMVGEGLGLHGEQVGLGAILMAARYEDSDAPPVKGFELSSLDLKNYLSRAGAPTSIREINISTETAVRALLECKNLRPERYTILHHAPFTQTAALKLLKQTDMLTETQQPKE